MTEEKSVELRWAEVFAEALEEQTDAYADMQIDAVMAAVLEKEFERQSEDEPSAVEQKQSELRHKLGLEE